MVKCLEYCECRNCNSKYAQSNIALAEGEEFDVVMRIIAKCPVCKKAEARTTNGPKRRLPPAF